jgi:type VI secretion system protein VasD
MVRITRMIPLALMLAGCGMLAACKASPPKPQLLKLSFSISADVNPDDKNRPSPIVLRIYQLKDDAPFKDAEFFALSDKEQATLGPALVSRLEVELNPGEQRTVDFQLSPDAHFVGVAAQYRDYRNAAWRAEIGSQNKPLAAMIKKKKLTVAATRALVTVSAQ